MASLWAEARHLFECLPEQAKANISAGRLLGAGLLAPSRSSNPTSSRREDVSMLLAAVLWQAWERPLPTRGAAQLRRPTSLQAPRDSHSAIGAAVGLLAAGLIGQQSVLPPAHAVDTIELTRVNVQRVQDEAAMRKMAEANSKLADKAAKRVLDAGIGMAEKGLDPETQTKDETLLRRAEERFTLLIEELAPSFVGGYTNRANVRVALGDYEGAVSDYTEALRLAPVGSDVWVNRLNRGSTLLALGRADEALADLQVSVALSKADRYALCASPPPPTVGLTSSASATLASYPGPAVALLPTAWAATTSRRMTAGRSCAQAWPRLRLPQPVSVVRGGGRLRRSGREGPRRHPALLAAVRARAVPGRPPRRSSRYREARGQQV